MINYLIDLVSSTCPYPHIIDGKQINGISFNQPKICRMCSALDCSKDIEHIEKILRCSKNVNYYQKKVSDNKLIILNGILIRGYQYKIPRRFKKKMVHVINDSAIEKWKCNIDEMIDQLENSVNNRVNETLGMLHDVKTAVSIIFRNAEELIYEEAGETIDEKIQNAPPAKKRLFKSVSLLEERLKMMSLVSNPESASHGGKNPFSIYRFFDKILKIFQPIANKKHITLCIKGSSFMTPNLYSSFTTIPLVLIDNAIKYSQPNQNITVSINDIDSGVSVQVESYSLQLTDKDKENIFKKNFRGNKANRIAVEGSGLGLYLADVVAYANGFEISHSDTGVSCLVNGVPYINNIFSFYVSV